MIIETGVGKILKKKYCESNKGMCARYLVLCQLGPEYVDNTLFPYMMDRAHELIQLNKDDAEALDEECFDAVMELV